MLIINQGVQDTSSDGKFDVIKEKGVFGKIVSVKLHEDFENTLNIEIDIIDNPSYAGKKVWDNVTFDPTSEYAWKYRALRKCIGKPYTSTESPQIDIEKLLLGKKVKMNLDVRLGKDGNEYQKITYVAKKIEATEDDKAEIAEAKAVEPVEDTSEIEQDLPW